jgi:DNA-binding response OmpR family regulator
LGTLPARILIVEDNTDLRRMFKTALSLAGYDVEDTGDGIEALRLIENRQPDLVVLDLLLHSLDGVSVRQELASRALTSRIPVVIVTGSNLDTSTLAAACVLHKPVMPDELERNVRRCLRESAPAA